MFKIEQLDANITHEQQIADRSDGPVTLINISHVPEADVESFVAMWGDILRQFKSSPGFISAQFHRGTTGSTTFMNQAVWENIASYRDAFSNPDFLARIKNYPDGTVATPHLFWNEAVANICVA